jgi:hypothetical protein
MGRGDDKSETIRDFREFSRRHGMAYRAHQNRRQTGDHRAEAAFSLTQAVENEFERCFVRIKKPDWEAVIRAAEGDIERASR